MAASKQLINVLVIRKKKNKSEGRSMHSSSTSTITRSDNEVLDARMKAALVPESSWPIIAPGCDPHLPRDTLSAFLIGLIPD